MQHALHTRRYLGMKPGRGALINPAHPLARGLVGLWLLNEGTGNLVADLCRANNGSFAVTPPWGVGPRGAVLNPTGSAGQEAVVPHTLVLNVYPLTISVWFQTSAAATNQALVSKYLSGSFNGYNIFFTNQTLCAWYIRNGTDMVYDQTATPLGITGLNDGKWHHYVFTVDEFGGKVYVDTVLLATRIWAGTPGNITSTETFKIGRYTNVFNGKLDNVALYGRSLSATEVARLYAEPFAVFERSQFSMTALRPAPDPIQGTPWPAVTGDPAWAAITGTPWPVVTE